MCGREDEMRALRAAFAQASAGRGSVAFITGEPGIGKSRLLRELTGHARGAGAVAVTAGRCRAGRAPLTGRSGIPLRGISFTPRPQRLPSLPATPTTRAGP
jgi:predicted ATPase